MIFINKITSHETIDFAASELKKYIRMMQPNGGDVEISFCPNSDIGFRLGLMQDFGLDVSDAENTELDDIVYVDTDKNGGIIAGDNPRSVLLAVYEFLRQNGCRWLFPGVDGEYIPMKEIEAVKYRHLASCRYRGPCIEGACSQQILLETLDFMPKVGMNVFQMQFLVPTVFYTRYYTHGQNPKRAPEPLSNETMLQWKTACETEMSKRGIQFHDVGHGWTVAPFGVDTSKGWEALENGDAVPEWGRKYLPLINGKRELWKGVALNTQFCMSNATARKMIAEYIADYAELHSNVDYIHVWLGDSHNNHCTCEECIKKTVSDWYVMLLNEIDEAFKAKSLKSRVVFIAYTETTWAPLTETINNPDRFTMMLAPISRSYTRTLTDKQYVTPPFVRNNASLPMDLDEYLAHFRDWKKMWKGSTFCFEYHFWKHQAFEPSGLLLAKRIYEDIVAYKANGIDGIIACGSQRSFFPTGFAYYVFARKQYDTDLSFDEIMQDYFYTAFGEDWKQFVDYLYEIADCFGDKYMEGEESTDPSVSKFICPPRAEKLRKTAAVTEKGMDLIKAHYDSPYRIRTVSARLLEHHAVYCKLLSEAMAYKAEWNHKKALEAFKVFKYEMCSRELELERYYELFISMRYYEGIAKVHSENLADD